MPKTKDRERKRNRAPIFGGSGNHGPVRMDHNRKSEAVKAICVLALAILLPSQELRAHSGGLNKYGCHAGSQPYHCHRGGGGESSLSIKEVAYTLALVGLVVFLYRDHLKISPPKATVQRPIKKTATLDRSPLDPPLLPNTPIQTSWAKRPTQADSLHVIKRRGEEL